MTEDERAIRLKKLNTLKEMGKIPYKDKFNRTHWSIDVKTDSLRDPEKVLEKPENKLGVAGRIVAMRDHGGIIFLNIQDMKGEIQISLKENILPKDEIELFREFIDLGDFIGINGEPFITKQGKLAILATNMQLLSKSIRALPSEHFGIKDTEIKYRKRYLDLILNKSTKDRFIQRSLFVEALRQYLIKDDFIEVVTRTLQTVPGGALAKPFTTHHNMLDLDLYLRVSNELDLKMVVAGGLERVFEFAIDFRNEGIDSQHLQEFQMLEWYAAYQNYEDGIKRTQKLLEYATKKAFGTTSFSFAARDKKNYTVDFSKEIPQITYEKLLKKYDIDLNASKKDLIVIAKDVDISHKDLEKQSRSTLLDLIYKKKIRPNLFEPIFITSYPSDMLPLARRNDKNPDITDSYQLVINEIELVKGYSELTDPSEQLSALKEQEKLLNEGDEEGMRLNKEFVDAIEHGFPPITGWGMGIDRAMMLFTGQGNVKDSVLFPMLGKSEKGEQ